MVKPMFKLSIYILLCWILRGGYMQISSSAYPPNKTPPLRSEVHSLIAQHIRHNQIPQTYIRKITPADLQQLRILQKEWFPLDYSQSFYNKILHAASICYVAEVTLQPEQQQKPVRAIVGAVVFQTSQDSDHLNDGWLNRMVLWQDRSVYIMTLGVVDEMRSRGLAKKLLDKIIDYCLQRPHIKFITLHVVDYNKRAINFYRKQGFELLQRIQNHYHIMGQEYAALKLGLFINGGTRREGWIPWIKRVVFGKTQIDEWPM